VIVHHATENFRGRNVAVDLADHCDVAQDFSAATPQRNTRQSSRAVSETLVDLPVDTTLVRLCINARQRNATLHTTSWLRALRRNTIGNLPLLFMTLMTVPNVSSLRGANRRVPGAAHAMSKIILLRFVNEATRGPS
jgi:hypothetical protein